MFDIVIALTLFTAFTRRAHDRNRDRYLWGFIGSGSYYLPIQLWKYVFFPMLKTSSFLAQKSPNEIENIAFSINFVTGVICCFTAYYTLSNLPEKLE